MARRFSRLPPLNTLLVFEAAGRHLNFSSAAAELGMTQPAVSHQVGFLEGQLGILLFRRLHRGVVLTPAGAQLLDAVSQGLTTIQDAASALRRRTGPKILHVFTDYGFAAWWLIPRLGRWSERVPEVEVQLVTAQRQVDLRQAEADVAVWFGDGSWRGRRIVQWFPETVYPVCSPEFARRHPMRGAAGLRDQRLLHVAEVDPPLWMSWSDWFEAEGVAVGKRTHDLIFNNYQLVLQAALLGQGVALGWRPLIDDLVQSRQLVCLTQTPARTARGYYIVEPPGRGDDQVVDDFHRWLMEERGNAASFPGQ
ncbi:MAG: choline sulfate utilization transcriptional regulator [Steroidobacteraceae bacterium]